MLSRLIAVAILFVLYLLSASTIFSQEDHFLENVNKNLEKSKKEKALRPKEENKLSGNLSTILKLSEQADTSKEKKEELSLWLKMDKDLHTDNNGNIIIIIELFSLNDTDNVKQMIQSVGGEIVKIGLTPYISCKIRPKKLRNIISSNLIREITKSTYGSVR